MTDELRNRLRRLDPMHPDVRTDATSPSSPALLEEIMSTPVAERPTPTTTGRGAHRQRWLLGAAAAAVAVVAIGAVALTGGDDDTGDLATGPPLELSLGEGGAMASCLAFDVAILADMPVAFEGTVSAVDGERVTLQVDRWFTGGDAAEVTLTAPAGMQALIGGIDFVEGQPYLVTAADGVVNYCGYTDAATPELRAAFEQAFPG